MILDIIFLIVCLVVSITFCMLVMTSKKYNTYLTPLDDKEFPVKEIYGAGFRLIEILHIDFKGKSAAKLRQEVAILYGEKYSEFYLRIIYAQCLTMFMICLVFGCVLSCLVTGTDKIVLFGLGIVLAVLVFYNFYSEPEKKIKKRSADFLSEFPNAVSTIALLVNSGMVLREAWSEVAYLEDSELYREMQKVNEDMNNGMSETDALYEFANRSATPEIKKFTSFVIQGLEKGSKDLVYVLKNQNSELWESKKQSALKQGELASGKLLIPILIMFLGILIMVMGPIMTNFGI